MQTKYLAKSTKYQTYRSEHVGPLVRHCVKVARAFLCPGDAKIALDSSWNPLKLPKGEKKTRSPALQVLISFTGLPALQCVNQVLAGTVYPDQGSIHLIIKLFYSEKSYLR
jgi:hypothetical protein